MTKREVLEDLNISIADKNKDIEYINKLNKTEDKVKYLRFIKKYTQEKAADLAGISTRHLQRIEKEFKNI